MNGKGILLPFSTL